MYEYRSSSSLQNLGKLIFPTDTGARIKSLFIFRSGLDLKYIYMYSKKQEKFVFALAALTMQQEQVKKLRVGFGSLRPSRAYCFK